MEVGADNPFFRPAEPVVIREAATADYEQGPVSKPSPFVDRIVGFTAPEVAHAVMPVPEVPAEGVEA